MEIKTNIAELNGPAPLYFQITDQGPQPAYMEIDVAGRTVTFAASTEPSALNPWDSFTGKLFQLPVDHSVSPERIKKIFEDNKERIETLMDGYTDSIDEDNREHLAHLDQAAQHAIGEIFTNWTGDAPENVVAFSSMAEYIRASGYDLHNTTNAELADKIAADLTSTIIPVVFASGEGLTDILSAISQARADAG